MSSMLPLSEAPRRPKGADCILADGPDRVYEAGRLRWRYNKRGKLIRVLEYPKGRPGYPPTKIWQDDPNA